MFKPRENIMSASKALATAPSLDLPNPTGPLTHMLSFVGDSAPDHQVSSAFKAAMAKLLTFRTPARTIEAANEQRINTPTPLPPAHQYTTCWASNAQELRAAQALRWQVFADELGAKLASPVKGLDIDPFDRFCHHLLVKDASGKVVGTYRALLPEQAELACGWYSSTEFYLKPLLPYAARMMEVGRSCVHPDHRNGTVMMMLWQELARFMDANKLDMLFGCASVPTRADGARMAARIWQHAIDKQMLDTQHFCKPKTPLDIEKLGNVSSNEELVMPPLLKGYMRLGARIASAPALDADFGCADFLIVLRKEDITPRYAKHFFGHQILR
jgi:putative hemolysin